MDFSPAKWLRRIPADFPLSYYDLFKTFAVLTMLSDHIGYYFDHTEMWWRAVGRLCVPVWFFLIGYARSRDIDRPLVIGGLLLSVASVLTGFSPVPLTILFTIIFIRLLLNPLMKWIGISEIRLYGSAFILFLLLLPSYFFTEYGTMGLLLAMCGYLVRHGVNIHKGVPLIFGMIVIGIGWVFNSFTFDFNPAQLALVVVGWAAGLAALYRYLPRAVEHPFYVQNTAGRTLLYFCGRFTLEIYVGHLILFKLLYFAFHGCRADNCIWH